MNTITALVATIIVSVLLSVPAQATTVIPMSVEELSQRSTHVIVAHANRSWSAWNSQHTRIDTYTEFSVDQWLKGSGDTVVTVKQPGGSADGYTQHVAGVRPWSAGESAVLFLQPFRTGTGFVVTGLMQGDFRLRHSSSGTAMVDNGLAASSHEVEAEVQAFNPSDKSVAPFTGNRMTLDQLERRVRSSLHTR